MGEIGLNSTKMRGVFPVLLTVVGWQRSGVRDQGVRGSGLGFSHDGADGRYETNAASQPRSRGVSESASQGTGIFVRSLFQKLDILATALGHVASVTSLIPSFPLHLPL